MSLREGGCARVHRHTADGVRVHPAPMTGTPAAPPHNLFRVSAQFTAGCVSGAEASQSMRSSPCLLLPDTPDFCSPVLNTRHGSAVFRRTVLSFGIEHNIIVTLTGHTGCQPGFASPPPRSGHTDAAPRVLIHIQRQPGALFPDWP